ncbi:uncharacterized protein LOC125679400 isoform X2 [Ostrea edulis]|uniref:uncharacterized protein LOC125679400 isoform X2 n=1 Tax=Ostrea edulis TaxID=37623 RepID=UPI002094463C|nr:uncharacterized protein LOC125679400 isoform X2 [Ostrea edulis]
MKIWFSAVFINFITYFVPNDGSCSEKSLSSAIINCTTTFNVTVFNNPHDRNLVCRAFRTSLTCPEKVFRDCDRDPILIARNSIALQYVSNVCGCVGEEIPVCTQNSIEDKLIPDKHNTNCSEEGFQNTNRKYYDAFNSSVLAKPYDKFAFKTLVYSTIRDFMSCKREGANILAMKYVADACDCTKKCDSNSTERKFVDFRCSLFLFSIRLIYKLYF